MMRSWMGPIRVGYQNHNLYKTKTITLSMGLFLIAILGLSCFSTSIFKQQDQALAQQYIPTIKHRNIVIDLGNGVKTNAHLTYPAIGKGPFPGVLLIQGAGAITPSPEIAPYLSVWALTKLPYYTYHICN